MNNEISKDQDQLLAACQPEIKKTNLIFRWINLVDLLTDDFQLIGQELEEKSDIQHEVPMTLVESVGQPDPILLNMGLWEMAPDFPIKFSG